jgi:divalent metal cation (Fe/Co/Zn/Cd) transporter
MPLGKLEKAATKWIWLVFVALILVNAGLRLYFSSTGSYLIYPRDTQQQCLGIAIAFVGFMLMLSFYVLVRREMHEV